MVTLLIFIVVVCVCAWVATWIIGQMPGVPAIIINIIWIIAVLVILWKVATALGIGGPAVPKL
jgi:hypothetical protein